jgi:hypothetical protein
MSLSLLRQLVRSSAIAALVGFVCAVETRGAFSGFLTCEGA